MNEEALKYSYELFTKDGYKGSIDDYKNLVNSNKEALDYSYQLFNKDGYTGNIDDFSGLLGITAQPIQQEVSVDEPPAPTQTRQIGYAPSTLSSIEQDTQGVVKDDTQQELERNPLISFGKMVAQTFQQIGAGFSAKGAGQISSLSSNQLAKLESIKDVPDDEIIKMPNLTDPRKGMREYKAGDYKRMAAERVVSGNKAAEAALEFAIKNQMELSESDVIQSLTQVKDGWDLVNFITASIGQAAAQIPLTVMTGGATSYAMESGNIYLEVVKEIAEKEGITPIEVIQQGKDQKALAEIGGALSGALELVGAKKVMEVFGVDNIKKDLRKRAMKLLINSQVEGATEVGQEIVSESAKGLAVEGRLKAPEITQALDAYAMGMFGAAGIQAPSLITRGGQKTVQEEQVEEPVSEEVEKAVEEVVEEQVDEIKPVILRANETDYGFIADADGNLELTKEGLDLEEAESIQMSLSKKYPNRNFDVKNLTDPNNPDAEANFTVVSSPKAKESYSLAGEQITREQALETIEKAESVTDLEGLDIQNDQDLIDEREAKLDLLNVAELTPQEEQVEEVTPQEEAIEQQEVLEQKEDETEQKTEEQAEVQLQQTEEITDERGEEQPKTESPPVIKTDTGKKGKGISPKIRTLYDKKKPFFDQIKGKFNYPKNATVAKIAKDYDAAKAKTERTSQEQEFIDFVDDRIKTPYKKPPSQKGKTPLDQRQLEGKEKKAYEVQPTSVQDIAEQWFLGGGRLSFEGLQDIFGKMGMSGRKSIELEKRARMSYIRTPEKGGKTVSEIVEEITNQLGDSPFANDQMAIRNAVEDAIKDRNSIAQMAKSILERSGQTEDAREFTPLERRADVREEDAIREMYTEEEWKEMSYEDKASALNDYYQKPSGSEWAYTPEMVEQNEKDRLNPTNKEVEWANEMWESMSQEERDLMEQGKLKLDELFSEEESTPVQEEVTPQEQTSRITFTVFGEKKTGVKQGEEFIADDGTRYKASMVENVKEVQSLTRKEQIELEKKELRDALKDVRDNFTKGQFDNLGVQFDLKKAMEADKKFYDAVVKAVRSLIRLKGLQAAEIYSELEKAMRKKFSADDRKYLKGIIDDVRKEIPKVNVMTETKGLTKDELTKQGLEEILEAKRRDAENKLKQEREKANERVQKAKDKGKAKFDEFKNIKKTMLEFLKMDLGDLPVSSFTRGEFQKVLTQIDKAKTDHTLNQAIEQAYDVFADAAKRQRVAEARNLVKRAKTNIKQGKIGVLEPNSLIDQMLRINPKFIPNNIFTLYQSIVSELGARKTVLGLSEKGEVNQSVIQVLNAIDMQENRVMELKDLYESYQDKDKDFSKTINKMLKEELITDEDAELMRLYKDDILGKPETPPTEKDIDQAVEDTMESIGNISIPDGTYSETEKSIIRTFKSITETDLRDLSYDEILRVGKIVDNLNNGFVPHLSERMRQRIEGYRSAKAVMPVLSSYKGSWTNFVSSLKASIKNIKNPRATTTLKEKIRRNPLSYIDQILENFKNTDVYDHVFRKLAKGQASYENDVNTYIETVRRVISKLPQGAKKQFDSRAKLMMLAIQREFESNPNQKGVNTAKAFLDATIDDKNSVYSKESKSRLKEIFDQYADSKGELDADKLYKDLSPSEKEAYDTINEMNRDMLRPKAMETSTLIRGNRVPIYENYIHLPLAVIGGKQNPTDVKNLQYGFQQTSTRAGSLTERVGKPHAILFDFFANSTEGAKMTLLDYNMTPSIKEVNNTLSKLYTLAQNDKDVDVVKALDDVYNEIMTNVFGIQMSSTSLGESIIQEAMRKGYQATLSGVGRSSSEFISNAMFAGVYKPTETLNGINVISNHNEVVLSKVVRNIKSAQSNRLYANSGMENKHIDFSKMNVKEVAKISGYDEGVLERMFRVLKQNPAYEFVDQLQAFMVSKPDQLIGRPMFFGAFDQQFEAITGKKPDYQKIADNDTQYMEENFEAIEQATNFADDVMVEAVASSNPIDGIVRNQVPPSKNAIYSWFKTFNGYMTRFPTYEYNSAVRAVNSLKNNGMLSSPDAVRLLVALNVRLFTYSLLTGTLVKMTYELILKSLFDYEPPEEDVDETVGNVLAKESLSALAMLAVNRNIGNVGKIPMNIALELANKKYGEGVTYEGKYDSFDNSIVYPIVPIDVERGQKSIAQSVIENTAGPLSPQVKTAFRTATALDRMLTSKKEETRDKYRHELMTRTPFEVLGNLGYIPAYKDLRAMQLQLMYNNVNKAEKATKDIDWSKYKK